MELKSDLNGIVDDSVLCAAGLVFEGTPISAGAYIKLPKAVDVDFEENEDENDANSLIGIDNEESSENSDWSSEIQETNYVMRNMDGFCVPTFPVDLSVLSESQNYEDLTEDERVGVKEWDPSGCDTNSIDEFLRATEVPENESNIIVEEGQTYHSCTREYALSVFYQFHYDVTAAINAMKDKNLKWSSKHSSLSSEWTDSEIQAFEKGMILHHKEWNKILQTEMKHSNKTCRDLLQFYYTWKKLPRYMIWQKEKTQRVTSSLGNMFSSITYPVYSEDIPCMTSALSKSTPSLGREDLLLSYGNITLDKSLNLPKRKYQDIETPNCIHSFNNDNVLQDSEYDSFKAMKRYRVFNFDPTSRSPHQLSDEFWDSTDFLSSTTTSCSEYNTYFPTGSSSSQISTLMESDTLASLSEKIISSDLSSSSPEDDEVVGGEDWAVFLTEHQQPTHHHNDKPLSETETD